MVWDVGSQLPVSGSPEAKTTLLLAGPARAVLTNGEKSVPAAAAPVSIAPFCKKDLRVAIMVVPPDAALPSPLAGTDEGPCGEGRAKYCNGQ